MVNLSTGPNYVRLIEFDCQGHRFLWYKADSLWCSWCIGISLIIEFRKLFRLRGERALLKFVIVMLLFNNISIDTFADSKEQGDTLKSWQKKLHDFLKTKSK
ncbi:TPA: hypothetical protein DIC40_01025 [Patescibacteria group bacterium]|nr:hypothetical protein [Candidatus Gracilibacteria bacterium]